MNHIRVTLASVVLLALAASLSWADAPEISVFVNGSRVQFKSETPRTFEGRVMIPLRGVLEKLGANVRWHPEERALTATRGDRDVFLPVGSRLAQVEGRPVRLDAPAVIFRGVLLVPLQVIADSLGADVRWDYRTQTVNISTAALFAGPPEPRPRAHRTRKR